MQIHSKLLCTALALACLSGCASTRVGDSAAEDGWGRPRNATEAEGGGKKVPLQNIEVEFRKGTQAYRSGNVDQAEEHFRTVLARNARHARATYNLSMIYLHRAYDGLQHYARIESQPERSARARKIVEKLDALRPAK